MTRFIFFPLEPARDPWHTARLSLPAAYDCRPADDMLLATEGAYQRISGTRGAPAVPHCEITVGSQRTGCSTSHRFSSPAIPEIWLFVSPLSRYRYPVNEKASIPQCNPRRILHEHGSQLVDGCACSSSLPDGVAAGIAVASSTRVGATHGRGL